MIGGMKKIIMIVFGLVLLLAAFLAGYFFRNTGCKVTQTPPSLPTAAVTASPTPLLTMTPTTAVQTELVFSNYNSAGVASQPTSPTVFTLAKPKIISHIQDYHWNSARGAQSGTIGLKSADGKTYGPWDAKGDPGQGGVPNAYLTVYPNIEIPAGTYTIIDSDPASWAHNGGTRGTGMSQVYAVK